jgi:hypothetical protein
MLYRQSDGSLINVIKNNYKNDKLFYKKIITLKNIQKQETVQSCFVKKEPSKDVYTYYSTKTIQNLLDS